MARKKKQLNSYRVILQWTIVVLLGYMVVRLFTDQNYIADFEAYCPFGGMLAFSSFIVNNTLACSMTETQIFMGLGLLAGVILFSKLFCSYICPIGTFTEWLGKIGDKWKMRYTIKGMADRILRVLKYALLFATFYFTVSASELFCREYDPFYAIFSGFGHDVFLWYAIPAVAIMILGAIFIRQFWCKYLCPLGAATNLFTNVIMFIAVLAVYFILLAFDFEISWVWPLAVISILGYLLETTRLQGLVFPALKITRNMDTCTNCKKCDKACPMAIDISSVETVNHIDCHLCGDCIVSCPEKEVLQINKREIRWVPASATVVLIAVGIFLASTVELPTINQRWGSEDQINQAAIFSQSGLKNIKCFGSSSSFATKMKKVDGVLGVETYVQSHSVKIFYDKDVLNEEDVKKSIFSPTRTLLRNPDQALTELSSVDLGIEKLFDSYDSFYLTQQLRQAEGIMGFATEFGEPVHASIFFDDGKITPQQIKSLIEKPEVTYTSRGKEYTQSLKFGVAYISDEVKKMSRLDFMREMFSPFDISFNDYKTYKPEMISVYEIPMPQAMNPALRSSIMSLVSHISTDSMIVRFETVYKDKPYAIVYFVNGKVKESGLFSLLTADTLTVHYSNGKTGQKLNPFRFPEKGAIVTKN